MRIAHCFNIGENCRKTAEVPKRRPKNTPYQNIKCSQFHHCHSIVLDRNPQLWFENVPPEQPNNNLSNETSTHRLSRCYYLTHYDLAADDSADIKALQGTWFPVKAELGGQCDVRRTPKDDSVLKLNKDQ